MPLFQTSVLKRYLVQQDQAVIDKAYKRYIKYFLNLTIQENIKNSKEEQFQATFLIELFVNVLNYTINPNPNFDLTTEFKNQSGAGKADGAILKSHTAIGVIELKGTNTKDLESIRKQAFDYKANQKGCVYVITSNFEKLRFYINDATEFLEFNLFQLAPGEFALLYLCLQKDNILNNVPLSIKEASLVEEDNITKQFYNDYSVFKRELFRDLVKRNVKRIKIDAVIANHEERSGRQSPENNNTAENKAIEKNVKLSLFKKSQKLIDRFLFIFFAEDRDLLPPNSTIQILDKWKADNDFGDERPLYNLFKQYFHFLDEGRKGTSSRAEIYAYNGGLFKPDAILDNLEIDDQLLYKHTYKLAKYDFSSQVDVNILGHIFENSLNEIESVNAEIEGGAFDKQKSKRKKDGVFYTPKYITKYIVENTVGKLCQEKKEALGFKEEAYFEIKRGTHQNTKKQLLDILDTYRQWLLQITICDPACGSGAFLNQALDYLIKEHTYLDELKAKVLGGGFVLSDIENTILENNIYGVDLNEESVDIAKLSLWLRTAQPRRKLNDLNSNIKCGNSLIDDKKVAGDKAFNWHTEFPQIFEKGGFDVVIGNPPYLRKQGLITHYPEMCKYYENKYSATTGNYDIYALFIEKSFELINVFGKVSFILPHKFLISDFGKGIRAFLNENKAVEKLVSFGAELVFQDATTYTCIIDLSKNQKESFLYQEISPENLFNFFDYNQVYYEDMTAEQWILSAKQNSNILIKISSLEHSLKTEFSRFVQGIITGRDAVYCLKGVINGDYLVIKDEFGNEHQIEKKILKPHLRGEDIKPYRCLINYEWLIFPYDISSDKAKLMEPEEFENKFPNAYQYLKNYEKTLRSRERGKFDNDYWYQYSRNQAISVLEQIKIITPEVCFGGSFTIDNKNHYHNSKCHSLLLFENSIYTYKSVLPIINSKLFWFYLANSGNVLRGGYIGVKRKVLEPFGLPNPINVDKELFSNYSDKIMNLIEDQDILVKKFVFYFTNSTSINKLTRKLENWHELDFADFIKELNKAIKKAGGVPLSKKDEFEWLELFEDNKKKAQDLQTQITQTEKAIDTMVYDLYGLTQEERDIVENS